MGKTLKHQKWIVTSNSGAFQSVVEGDGLRKGIPHKARESENWGTSTPLFTLKDKEAAAAGITQTATKVKKEGSETRYWAAKAVKKDDIPPTTVHPITPTEEARKAAQGAQERRRKKWEKKGKETFLKQFEADPQYAEKAPPLQKLTWEYRDIFGDDIKDCKEGFLYYEVELGHTMQGLNKLHFINQGPIKKAAMHRYLEVYEDAGVVSKTHKEAYSNAFLIKKPGHVAEHQEQMDDATFSKQ